MKPIISKLQADQVAQLTPLLGSLARMIAAGSPPDEEELEILMLGVGSTNEQIVLEELRLWVRLLAALKQKFSEEKRLATIEALQLRGLAEAPVVLAVHIIQGKQPQVKPTDSPTAKRLSVSMDRLDFGILLPGQGASAEIEVQGGPGQIVLESSELISVNPTLFDSDITIIRVEVKPQFEGVIYSDLKFITINEFLVIPVTVQWEQREGHTSENQANASEYIPEWATVQPAGGERHLPVYLLLDISASMAGAPIESITHGLEQFQKECASDPFARDIVKVGVITIGERADLVTKGLKAVTEFQPPQLTPSKAEITRLDLAFEVLRESFDRDVIKGISGGPKGDWKPAVFVLLDGRPTDESGNEVDRLWRPACEALINRPKGQIKPSGIVAVGCGINVDEITLRAISTGTAFKMGTNEAVFVALFQYLTQTLT